VLRVSDPYADLYPRRKQREREQSSRDAFVEHARQVLLARWGTSLSLRAASVPGGLSFEFPLVSGNGRIVGDVVWLEGLDAPEWKSAVLSEHVWVVSHLAADRPFVLVGHDFELVNRWLTRHHAMLDGVEVWSLEGDQLERLA
jgi:hypothetical protein